MSKGVAGGLAEFKRRSMVGMPGSGTYCKILTLVGWTDDSGGAVHQIGFDDNGNVFIREGKRISGWGHGLNWPENHR